MNIVIVGVGEVGFNLSKVLSKEGYNLTIIDINPEKCNRIKNNENYDNITNCWVKTIGPEYLKN